MQNRSFRNFKITELDGIRRGEDGFYYDQKTGCEVYEVGTERFVEEQLRKYGPESDLPKAENVFDHSDYLISSDYLEKHGWETVPISGEDIQRPYYYSPNHHIKDQIKDMSSFFGTNATIESILKRIKTLLGSNWDIKYTDTLTQKEYPAKLGNFIKRYNDEDKELGRFYRKENDINKRLNVISAEFSKLGYSIFLRVRLTAEASLHRA